LDPIKISIVIPVRNDPGHLRMCLRAVFDSRHGDFECLVVDDGSTDATPEVAEEFPAKVLRLPENRGPAFARNHGAGVASGEIIFFIDADIVIYPDTLAKIAEAFSSHPEIDALIGSYDDAPSDPKFISQYKNIFHHFVHQNSSESACSFWSGCGAIRRRVFLDYGGFNASYGRPAIEDIELGFRLTRDGHKIGLLKHIQVKHLKRWTFWGLLKTDVFDRGVPWMVIMLRDKNFPRDLNLKRSQRVCGALAFLFLPAAVLPAFRLALLPLPVLILAAILLINLRFYRFFVRKRGFLFAVRVVPMHLLYYLYGGLSVGLGLLAFVLGKKP
jgi:glycosyltransferase involved in cell wall biosynthesis